MKRFVCIVFSLVLVLGLAACSGRIIVNSDGSADTGRTESPAADRSDRETQAPSDSAGRREQNDQTGTTTGTSREAQKFLDSIDIESAEYKGVCGADALWYYKENVLVIKGAGEVVSAPWTENDKLNVNWIVVDEGITDLACRMTNYFSENDSDTSLSKVILPSTLTSISGPPDRDVSGAFRDAENLTRIDLPDGLTTIGDAAFWGCSSLTSITIPDGVTSIGIYAFSGCSGLTSITIPDGVTSIGEAAFQDCTSLTEINYNGPAEGYPWDAPLL